ncbi:MULTISPECIES: hypothetical protein [unclassified Nocardiopsis]|uniref:hypothetical protein n=1 Tax=unclassified Nocardiopsis TaxID=2649073 RepID=UPI000A7B7EC5|nr:hypothetical protein [Nocardiopsis sp. TSRI0078]
MTVRDQALPDRSLLLRTFAPIVGPLSPDSVTCDVTAAYVWGVDLYPPGTRATRTRPHVSVPRGVRTSGVPVVAHREPVPAADRTAVEGVRITTPARTAADLAARAPSVYMATARLDAFLSRGLVTRSELVGATHRPRSAHRLRRLRTALRYSSALSRSPAESWTRALVLEARPPPPVPQGPVVTDEGLFHADLGWPDQRVALEYDSLEFHSSASARAGDRIRYAAMRARDREVVPVSVYDLRCRPEQLRRRLLGTLVRRGWSRPPEHLQGIRDRVRAYGRTPPRLFDHRPRWCPRPFAGPPRGGRMLVPVDAGGHHMRATIERNTVSPRRTTRHRSVPDQDDQQTPRDPLPRSREDPQKRGPRPCRCRRCRTAPTPTSRPPSPEDGRTGWCPPSWCWSAWPWWPADGAWPG